MFFRYSKIFDFYFLKRIFSILQGGLRYFGVSFWALKTHKSHLLRPPYPKNFRAARGHLPEQQSLVILQVIWIFLVFFRPKGEKKLGSVFRGVFSPEGRKNFGDVFSPKGRKRFFYIFSKAKKHCIKDYSHHGHWRRHWKW